MHSGSSSARISRSQRAMMALDFRLAGKTYREVGQLMGFSEQRAHQLVTQELQRLNALRAEAAAEVMRLEAERLDALLAGLWDAAKGGDVAAVDKVLAIMGRRAKLYGLDAPTKVAPTTPDGSAPWEPALRDLTDEELAVMAKLHERMTAIATSADAGARN
jgi:hypothetical protein